MDKFINGKLVFLKKGIAISRKISCIAEARVQNIVQSENKLCQEPLGNGFRELVLQFPKHDNFSLDPAISL